MVIYNMLKTWKKQEPNGVHMPYIKSGNPIPKYIAVIKLRPKKLKDSAVLTSALRSVAKLLRSTSFK